MHEFKPDKMSVQRRRSGHHVPLLNKKLFAIDTFWERKNPFTTTE